MSVDVAQLPSMMDSAAIGQYVAAQLRDPEVVGATIVQGLDKAEEATGVKREQIAYVFMGLYALFLVFGGMAGLACNIAGFAYPCFASFKAIESNSKDDDTHWLTYWCVFGAFSLVDAFADPLMAVLPVYWLLKCIFLIYLYHPLTKGALVVYKKAVVPLFMLMGVGGGVEGQQQTSSVRR